MFTDTDLSSSFNQTFGSYNSSNYNNGVTAAPSEDRYAALKDLDSLMKQTQLKEDTTKVAPASPWTTNNSNANGTRPREPKFKEATIVAKSHRLNAIFCLRFFSVQFNLGKQQSNGARNRQSIFQRRSVATVSKSFEQ